MFHKLILLDGATKTPYKNGVSQSLCLEIHYVNRGMSIQKLSFQLGRLLREDAPCKVNSILLSEQWVSKVSIKDLERVLTTLYSKVHKYDFTRNSENNLLLGVNLTIGNLLDPSNNKLDLSRNSLWRIPVDFLIKFLIATPTQLSHIIMSGNDLIRLPKAELRALLIAIPPSASVIDLRKNGFEQLDNDFIAVLLSIQVYSLIHCKQYVDLAAKKIKPKLALKESQLQPIVNQLLQKKDDFSHLVAGLLLAGQIDLLNERPNLEIRTHAAIDMYVIAAQNHALRIWSNLLLWCLKTNTTIPSVQRRLGGFDVPAPAPEVAALSPQFQKPLTFFMPILDNNRLPISGSSASFSW
ncbi:MAG: hypothetical protein EPN84_04150 [Legionella sp.]|nr:MAG: hypothetical protein EPN84_04150 [Legionella sp.]